MRLTFARGLLALAVLHAGTLAARADEDFQHGETVLPAAQAPADAPMRRHAKAPWFELSNLRKDTHLSLRGDIALDFRREGDEGFHDIVMVVKGKSGRREFQSRGFSPFGQKQGTVSGKSWFGSFHDPIGDQLEVWLEQHSNYDGKPFHMKVSKSITLGNVNQRTYARQWTDDEQKAFKNWEKSMTPPGAPPTGYRLADADMPLLAGMPILAGWMAGWQPAEVIDVRKDGSILVKYREVSSALITRQRNWIAVEDKTLEAGRSNPGQFQASLKVLPNGRVPIPADLQPLEAETPLVVGTPLQAERFTKWVDVTLTEIQDDGKLRIHWDKHDHGDGDLRERSTLLITSQTLEALKKPGTAEQFAKRAEKFAKGTFESLGEQESRPKKDFPIKITIPKSAVLVTAETPVTKGTTLGCSWGHKWYDVEVMEVNEDGTLKIHWDRFGDSWDGDVSRDQLIIDKKVLAKLEPISKKDDSAKPETAPVVDKKFKVVLKQFGKRKMAVTKVVMGATGLDPKEAKEFVETAPVIIKQNLTKADAEKLRKDLEAQGGTATLESQ